MKSRERWLVVLAAALGVSAEACGPDPAPRSSVSAIEVAPTPAPEPVSSFAPPPPNAVPPTSAPIASTGPAFASVRTMTLAKAKLADHCCSNNASCGARACFSSARVGLAAVPNAPDAAAVTAFIARVASIFDPVSGTGERGQFLAQCALDVDSAGRIRATVTSRQLDANALASVKSKLEAERFASGTGKLSFQIIKTWD